MLNIGHNVEIQYDDMDFGSQGTSHLKLLGRAPSGANTIQLRFLPQDDAQAQEIITILEISQCGDYQLFDFDFAKIKGLQKVSFVFLPGCNFDFKDFIFS